ncbi:DUF1643 domain-containing protein [Pontixanthobacter aquaemixtae]|uniref:DUF1643 domain-containing protein n=1 Tax=Pontixanthobacter aquaemixtae TaxID=1958940 RepID=A0A844ZY43_9SPHN|nr:DUF1643 domain-containing protein [Pontixanthobacter aquaemixtae]MXO91856.1 DUF1643 domain-containing protein [Pontixanthobacter aquaemixtae]
MDAGAVFSKCSKYRYLLWRIWDPKGPLWSFGMLNPSTADHLELDPTITRCRNRAETGGAGGLLIWNLFAYRATFPADLKAAKEPIGSENDAAIFKACAASDIVIAGWGAHGSHRNRDHDLRGKLAKANVELHALAFTKYGLPRHPLYLSYQLRPEKWVY